MTMRVSIKEAAKTLGVTIETLRRWEADGKIRAERTPGGHRRYDLTTFDSVIAGPILKDTRKTFGYARVSGRDQNSDLKRQIQLLESFCSARGWQYEILSDLGSGLNFQKKNLKLLIKKICSGEVDRLVLTHKDRLLRFGSELVFSLCEQFQTEVVIMNASIELSFEEELAQDVLEIITVFSARLYGARSHKNKKIVQALKEAAHEACG